MKVDISIEFDKELATAIMDTVREISKGIKSLQGIFDKSEWSVSTESVLEPEPGPEPEPEPEPKKNRPAAKRKPRAKKTIRGTVLKIIKQNKEGISRKALKEETGFSAKQISNCIFQLKKNQKIQMTADGWLTIL